MSASGTTTVHLFDSKELAAELVSQMSQGDVVLVKASRAEKFEEVAELIVGKWNSREVEGVS